MKLKKQIITLQDLAQAARDKRSVTCETFHIRRMPAAWMINIIGSQIVRYLDAGIYLYESAPRLSKFSDRYKQPETKQETKLLENK